MNTVYVEYIEHWHWLQLANIAEQWSVWSTCVYVCAYVCNAELQAFILLVGNIESRVYFN